MPQISNSKWFPGFLRGCMHEFMTWFVQRVNAAQPFLPVVEEGLKYTNGIVEVKMNVGAGFETLDPLVPAEIPRSHIEVNNFNAEQEGLYVFVNSFHQLDRIKAFEVLSTIARNNRPVVVLEGNNDSLWQVFGMVVIVPLTVLLTAPFVRPFRIERLVFTYLIPILPIVTCIDGFLALFKLYSPKDMEELVSTIPTRLYQWKSGKLDNGRGGKIIYLLGHPTQDSTISKLGDK